MNKKIVCIHDGILFSHRKEQDPIISDSINEARKNVLNEMCQTQKDLTEGES
jgi:hypothetical protein